MRRVDSRIEMHLDPDILLEMLRDPNRETQEIATAAQSSREDAGRASRLVLGIAKAKPEEILTLPGSLAMALLRAAATGRRADMLAAAAAHSDRSVAKESKRALYLLKARGVPVPDPVRKQQPSAPAPLEPTIPCYASVIDGRGERAIWIGRVVAGKGVEISQIVVSELTGIVHFRVAVIGRKEYRSFSRDLLERGRSMGVMELDRSRALATVASARKLNDVAGKRPPDGADAWLARLGPVPALEDPRSRFQPLPGVEGQTAVAESGRLHDLPMVNSWLAPEEDLRALTLKLDEMAVSSLYIDEEQRSDAARSAIEDAIASQLDGTRRALWVSRLFSLAEHLERTGDTVHYGLAVATASALHDGADARDVPFVRLLIEKAVPPPASAPRDQLEHAGSGSLIVAPERS